MRKLARMALAVYLTGAALGVQAWEQGDILLRAGAVTVDPDADSDVIRGNQDPQGPGCTIVWALKASTTIWHMRGACARPC